MTRAHKARRRLSLSAWWEKLTIRDKIVAGLYGLLMVVIFVIAIIFITSISYYKVNRTMPVTNSGTIASGATSH